MTIIDCILYCINQFREWAEAGEAGIDGAIELRHDGLEHGLVYYYTGLMVVPGDDNVSERAELATLLVGECLLWGNSQVTLEGISYEIPHKFISVSNKLSENFSELKALEPEKALELLLKEV